jgi:hypothetical protein
MNQENFETVELGHAEVLIEICLPMSQEEIADKFESGAAPYVEFE